MPAFSRLKKPLFLASYFGAEEKLSVEQQMDILAVRIVKITGWTWEYIQECSIEVLGKIVSYEEGIEMARKVANAK